MAHVGVLTLNSLGRSHKFAILVFSGGCLLTLSSAGALAQGWPPSADNIFRSPRSEPWVDPEPRSRQRLAPFVQDGGARPELLAEPPPVVAFAHDYPANSLLSIPARVGCTTSWRASKPTSRLMREVGEKSHETLAAPSPNRGDRG